VLRCGVLSLIAVGGAFLKELAVVVVVQGLNWPGVASRHSQPGPDDWHGVTAVDADHLQLDSAMPLPDYRAGVYLQFRQPLPLDGVQLAVLFMRRGGAGHCLPRWILHQILQPLLSSSRSLWA